MTTYIAGHLAPGDQAGNPLKENAMTDHLEEAAVESPDACKTDERDAINRFLANRTPWRAVTVLIPPEDPRFPDGWWVHSRTRECVNGALEISDRIRPSSRTATRGS
jgi:hypothetical protein